MRRPRGAPVAAARFFGAFDFNEMLDKVTIDVSRARFRDLSAVTALDKVALEFRREGAEVEILGMNEASATIVGKLAVHDKPAPRSTQAATSRHEPNPAVQPPHENDP